MTGVLSAAARDGHAKAGEDRSTYCAEVASRRRHAWKLLPLRAGISRHRYVKGIQARCARATENACTLPTLPGDAASVIQRALTIKRCAPSRHRQRQHWTQLERIRQRVIDIRRIDDLVASICVPNVPPHMVYLLPNCHG